MKNKTCNASHLSHAFRTSHLNQDRPQVSASDKANPSYHRRNYHNLAAEPTRSQPARPAGRAPCPRQPAELLQTASHVGVGGMLRSPLLGLGLDCGAAELGFAPIAAAAAGVAFGSASLAACFAIASSLVARAKHYKADNHVNFLTRQALAQLATSMRWASLSFAGAGGAAFVATAIGLMAGCTTPTAMSIGCGTWMIVSVLGVVKTQQVAQSAYAMCPTATPHEQSVKKAMADFTSPEA